MQRYLQFTHKRHLLYLLVPITLLRIEWPCVCDLSPGEEPVGVHAALPLDLDLAPHLAVVAAQVVKQHLGLVRHLDLHRLAGCLHPEESRVKCW